MVSAVVRWRFFTALDEAGKAGFEPSGQVVADVCHAGKGASAALGMAGDGEDVQRVFARQNMTGVADGLLVGSVFGFMLPPAGTGKVRCLHMVGVCFSADLCFVTKLSY